MYGTRQKVEAPSTYICTYVANIYLCRSTYLEYCTHVATYVRIYIVRVHRYVSYYVQCTYLYVPKPILYSYACTPCSADWTATARRRNVNESANSVTVRNATLQLIGGQSSFNRRYLAAKYRIYIINARFGYLIYSYIGT